MRVLVIEDDPAVATAIRRGLAAEGLDVDVADDGDTGLWMALEVDYGVIVLDVMLPGRNGYRVCADLRAAGSTTPILMLTAKAGDFDVAEGLDAGADDHLAKPFSFVVLTARIRALLRRAGPRDAVVQVIGDLEIDFDQRRCRRRGEAVELTSREFNLLEVLSRHPGAVCSKPYLLDQVWGPDFDGGTNVVEVYVGYLRRKLEVDGADRLIHTVHGHGYRIEP